MKISISPDSKDLGRQSALFISDKLNSVIRDKGEARVVVSTGSSQFDMFSVLVNLEVDWQKVEIFHLDEYIGLPETHPASFRKYLKERFVNLVPVKEFNYVNGETDPYRECSRLGEKISEYPVDVAFIGIGENGHVAFNDPPADFETTKPYIVVNLDEACRRQQLGEGWFRILEEVPHRAISMSVKQIMKSEAIICSVPDRRKADAV